MDIRSSPNVPVWDIGLRLFHWSLVGSFSLAYLIVDPRAGSGGPGQAGRVVNVRRISACTSGPCRSTASVKARRSARVWYS